MADSSATSHMCVVIARAVRRTVVGPLLGDGQSFLVEVAGRDRAPLGGEVDDQLLPHPGSRHR